MKLQKTILRSKVARRVFALFLACSLFPVVVLTVISSRMMTAHLEDQGQRQLRQTTKSVGMVILGRLSHVEAELRALAVLDPHDRTARENAAWTRLVGRLGDRVNGIGLVGEAGVVPLFGDILTLSEFPEASRQTLRAGRVTLALVPDDDGPARSLLGLSLDARVGRAGFLVAEVANGYLWNTDEEMDLPWDMELLVLDSDRGTLFTTLDSTELASAELLKDRAGTHGEFRVSVRDRAHRGHAWPISLEARYGRPGWTLLVTQPAEGFVASLAWASKILPLTIVLCLLVVALLSLVQIRKSLVPIISLREGTRRIAEGQFHARVTVASNDEFEELAESFNGMAGRLGAQFHTLTTLAEIDRELLSKLDPDQIVETLLLRIPDRLRCDRATVVLAKADGTDDARLHGQGPTATGGSTTPLTSELRQLFRDLDDPVALPDALPPAVADALGSGLAECLIVPFCRNSITGCLVLGFRRRSSWTDEEMTEARRLVNQAGVALANARLLQQLERVNRETLHALARAVDANSPWTAGHSERVTGLSLELARQLGVDDDDLAVLHRGGLLHDVGKIGIPGHIVDKPGRLSEQEFALMRDHVRIGARILEPISGYRREIPIVLHHHERYDGSGYPDGLADEGIPYLARILTVADVFDALVSDRPYRSGWELSRIVEYMKESAGTMFDPAVVEVFLRIVEDGAVHPYLRGEESWILPAIDPGAEYAVAARS